MTVKCPICIVFLLILLLYLFVCIYLYLIYILFVVVFYCDYLLSTCVYYLFIQNGSATFVSTDICVQEQSTLLSCWTSNKWTMVLSLRLLTIPRHG